MMANPPATTYYQLQFAQHSKMSANIYFVLLKYLLSNLYYSIYCTIHIFCTGMLILLSEIYHCLINSSDQRKYLLQIEAEHTVQPFVICDDIIVCFFFFQMKITRPLWLLILLVCAYIFIFVVLLQNHLHQTLKASNILF